MKKIIRYVAFDGVEFESEKECEQYECKIVQKQHLKRIADAVYDYCDSVQCADCILRENFCGLADILYAKLEED